MNRVSSYPPPQPWECWVVYHHDMHIVVTAVFPSELEALRYAVSEGYPQKVQRVRGGEIRSQLTNPEGGA